MVLCFFWTRPPTQQSRGSHWIAEKSSSPSSICYFLSPFLPLSSDETKHSQVVFLFLDFVVLLDDFVVATVPAILGLPPCHFGFGSLATPWSVEDRRGFDKFLRLRVEDAWRRESQRERPFFLIIKIIYWVAVVLHKDGASPKIGQLLWLFFKKLLFN